MDGVIGGDTCRRASCNEPRRSTADGGAGGRAPHASRCAARPRSALGALLAIPVAGILHVIGRDLYDGYRGRIKPEPTIGEDEVPMSAPAAPDRSDEPPRTVTAADGGGAGRRLGDGTGRPPRRGM
jgi:hypothetical protein